MKDLELIVDSMPFLLQGLGLSLLLAALAAAGGIMMAVVLALLRLSSNRFLSGAAAVYVNFFRSMPLILVIFWFFFLVPMVIGRPVGSFYSALIAFTLFEAAHYTEIIRAGILSVSRGQGWAAAATGLTYGQSLRHVILPQAFRNMTPLLLTQGIILFQDTSLVFVVSLSDFLTTVTIVARNEGRLVSMYVFAALVYFALCFAASRVVGGLQKKAIR
ncbi:amino acid ABC transporter permease [Rhizobium sp. Root482]|uniref:amino acid ABC transporter permease n=1 Tax=Rhizobium sp. Root482 TaxID=1736543 RepID=UPI000700FE57|nr:ABC transporter permease subunit [Rhizobium sp. Root482]KQY12273.1 amino acid ABC transporter permease [Rhizobium sp. Root482]